jgi:hypothetical protein
MPSENDSVIARVQSSYKQLAEVAADLNTVSDSLGQMIGDLDSALKKLNLGITVWVRVHGNVDEVSMNYWSEDIGYAKCGGKWGIALRKVDGNYNNPDLAEIESWLFNDGPRKLRLDSIEFIPELLETLNEHAVNTIKQVIEKLKATEELVKAVKEAAAEPKPQPPLPTRQITGGKKQ